MARPQSNPSLFTESVDTSGGSRRLDKGGGGCHPDPEIRGGPGLPKICFRPFGPQFGLKPLNPPLHNGYPGDTRPLWRGSTATGIWICRCFGASARTNNDNDSDNDSDGIW